MNSPHNLIDPTLDDQLKSLVASRGDDVFIVEENGRATTYAELDQAATGTARRLLGLGVGSSDVVAALSTTTLDLIILLYGIHRVGAVAAMINPASIEREVAVTLRKSGARLLVVDTTSELSIGDALPQVPGVQAITMSDLAAVSPSAADGQRPTSHDDPATMIFTSGTTSEPKAVVYRHGHQAHGARNYATNMNLGVDDFYMHHFPLFHMNGLNQLGSVLHAGARLLLVARFRSSRFDALLDEFAPTTTFLNGTHVKMLRSVDAALHRPSPLSRVGMSLQMSDDDYDWFESKHGATFIEGYGLTESVAMCLSNPFDGTRKRQCCGLPSDTYAIRVVDDAGADVPAGATGELWVRSSSRFGVMDGYAADAEATAEALEGGWLHTGDIVRRDDDGYVYYVERQKDLIKRAGENISASEVKDIIEQLPGVDEAAVVGRPDVLREELPVAFVTLDGQEQIAADDVIDHCRRHLAAYKVPVDVTFVDEFPRTAVGKVERRTLRDWAATGIVTASSSSSSS